MDTGFSTWCNTEYKVTIRSWINHKRYPNVSNATQQSLNKQHTENKNWTWKWETGIDLQLKIWTVRYKNQAWKHWTTCMTVKVFKKKMERQIRDLAHHSFACRDAVIPSCCCWSHFGIESIPSSCMGSNHRRSGRFCPEWDEASKFKGLLWYNVLTLPLGL